MLSLVDFWFAMLSMGYQILEHFTSQELAFKNMLELSGLLCKFKLYKEKSCKNVTQRIIYLEISVRGGKLL